MSQPFLLRNPLQLVVYLLWWILWCGIQALIVYQLLPQVRLALEDAALTNLLLGIGGFAIASLYAFYLPGNTVGWFSGLLALMLSFLVTLFFNELAPTLISSDSTYLSFMVNSQYLRFGYALVSLAYLSIFSLLWNRLETQKQTQMRQAETERLVKDAELARLRLQLQPHFLFNSLNSISALVGSNPKAARTMIEQLADFLRGTLKKEDEKMVSLQDEITHLQLYLEIEKVRFGNRLQFVMNVTPEASECQLPTLLLQPIIENAIKFGLYNTLQPIEIKLQAVKNSGILSIQISNPFDEHSISGQSGTGFGLKAVTKRLYLLYGRQDLVRTHSSDNHFHTQLLIPQP